MSVKVLEPITKAIKEFKAISDFNEYYANHKSEMDEMTTQKLNKTYSIVDGGVKYVVTKIKGEISLKRKYVPPAVRAALGVGGEEGVENCVGGDLKKALKRITQLEDEMGSLSEQLESLTVTLNDVIQAMNGG